MATLFQALTPDQNQDSTDREKLHAFSRAIAWLMSGSASAIHPNDRAKALVQAAAIELENAGLEAFAEGLQAIVDRL